MNCSRFLPLDLRCIYLHSITLASILDAITSDCKERNLYLLSPVTLVRNTDFFFLFVGPKTNNWNLTSTLAKKTIRLLQQNQQNYYPVFVFFFLSFFSTFGAASAINSWCKVLIFFFFFKHLKSWTFSKHKSLPFFISLLSPLFPYYFFPLYILLYIFLFSPLSLFNSSFFFVLYSPTHFSIYKKYPKKTNVLSV